MLIQTWKEANERSTSFVDHSGKLRDVRTGKPLEEVFEDDDVEADEASSEFRLLGSMIYVRNR